MEGYLKIFGDLLKHKRRKRMRMELSEPVCRQR